MRSLVVVLGACEQNEEGAIAVLTQLMLGLRSNEVLFRQVRDLDDEGAILWIPNGKTSNDYVNPETLKNSSVRRLTEVLASSKAAGLAELLERLGSLAEAERTIVLASLGAATKS